MRPWSPLWVHLAAEKLVVDSRGGVLSESGGVYALVVRENREGEIGSKVPILVNTADLAV
jgi:hypothetical protein